MQKKSDNWAKIKQSVITWHGIVLHYIDFLTLMATFNLVIHKDHLSVPGDSH